MLQNSIRVLLNAFSICRRLFRPSLPLILHTELKPCVENFGAPIANGKKTIPKIKNLCYTKNIFQKGSSYKA